MKGNILLPLVLSAGLLLVSTSVYSQKPIISYNLFDRSIDSILIPEFDTASMSDSYPHHVGMRHSDLAILDSIFPFNNVQPNSNFTFKASVNQYYDINSFPFSTTVKIFSLENGQWINNCSGNFIHGRHVLSAAHCFLDEGNNFPRPEIDSLFVCPMYDNGEPHSSYPCVQVSKLHSFCDWNLDSTDFAVLTINEPVGEDVGYLGLGFNQNSDDLERRLFYKFSYPNQSIMNPGRYNGDSLYFGYGGINASPGPYLSINNTFCEFGESGSHLVQVENDSIYRTLGTLTYGRDCKHNRIDRGIFYSLKKLVAAEILQNVEIKPNGPLMHVLPNPFQNSIKIQPRELLHNCKYAVFDLNGMIVDNGQINNEGHLDLSHLGVGTYILRVIWGDSASVFKIYKNR